MILEFGVLLIAVGLIVSIGISLTALFIAYKHLDNRIGQKFNDMDTKEQELYSHLSRINDARISDSRDMKKNIESIEQKLDVLLQPEGSAKEVAREKIMAKSK